MRTYRFLHPRHALLLLIVVAVFQQTAAAQQATTPTLQHPILAHTRSWQVHPEFIGHYPDRYRRVGMPTSDQGASPNRDPFDRSGHNAWRVFGEKAGLICSGLTFTLPEDVRGSMLLVHLRMRLPEAPIEDPTARPVLRVTVLEDGAPRLEQIISTDAPKLTAGSPLVDTRLRSDNSYGDVPAGQWRYGGGTLDIRIEYLGAVPFVLDYIAIEEDAMGPVPERQNVGRQEHARWR